MSYKNESYMLYFEIIRLIDKVQLCDLENYIYYKLTANLCLVQSYATYNPNYLKIVYCVYDHHKRFADIDRYMKMKIKCNQIS